MSEVTVKAAEPAAPRGAGAGRWILALLVLNLGASGLAIFQLMTAPAFAGAGPALAAPPPGTSEITGPVTGLEPFLVNLDEPGQARYLKVTFQLELVGEAGEAALARSKQLVRDTILSHLSGLHLADTLGAEAKERIRRDLAAKLDALLGPNRVRRIFYQEFVVQ